MICYLCRGRLGLRIGEHDVCPECWRLRYLILARMSRVTKPRGVSVPEIAWPGEELPPHEQKVVRELVEKGWVYLYCDGGDFAMQRPGHGAKEWWRIDRDGKPVRNRTRTVQPVPPATPVQELIAKLTALASPNLGFDPECRDRAPGATLAQVRSLVRQGYSGKQVHQMTGWGGYWFADMLDDDGYYNEERERA